MPDQITIEEEIYTYEYLWRSASRLLERAETQAEESFYFLLPSLLMSFMAFEAFVNFCGFVLLPELWKEEKKNFKGRGIEEKLKKIVAELPDFRWRKGESPYQGIKNLEDFRDIVSHGKVIASQYIAERKQDGSHFRFEHPWDTFLSVRAVESARSDIKSFCQLLLVELRNRSDHSHLNFNAFEGSLATGTGASKHG